MQAKPSYRFARNRHAPDPLGPTAWFSRVHPLAEVAWDQCHGLGHPVLASIACGACWERAVRDDERFAADCGLPREQTPDPSYVDRIAVDRACSGDRSVRLTRHELWAAVAELHFKGMSSGRIAARLNRDGTTVRRILAGLAAGAAA
jgi:hypothetical protein